VKTKYISMKIEPKGRIPAAGMMKLGSAYQAARGIGLDSRIRTKVRYFIRRVYANGNRKIMKYALRGTSIAATKYDSNDSKLQTTDTKPNSAEKKL
jgi:hypothetical protein